MAKGNRNQDRDLFSAAEWRLVEASRGKSLEKLTPPQLKDNITRVRRLRDKWRDLATGQRRRTQAQQGARVTDRNQRSAEKAELLNNVLAGLESRLARLGAAADAGKSPAKPARPSKKQRAEGHRLGRADVRKELEAKRSSMEARGAAPRQPAATKAFAASKTDDDGRVSKATPSPGAKKKTAKKSAKKKKVAKRKTAGATQTGSKSTSRSIPADVKKQQGAKTAAKKARIKASGLTSRVKGHVSARGKRFQGRRDAKG
jgi:hypothetical protein